MKTKELKAKVKELQEQLYILSEKIAKRDEPKIFPQEGEEYWQYTKIGYTLAAIANDSEGRLNAFRTEEECIKARNIQWAKQMVIHAISVLNKGWEPDWDNYSEDKYFIAYTEDRLILDCVATIKTQPNYMYCKTVKIGKQVIRDYQEDLLLIFSE